MSASPSGVQRKGAARRPETDLPASHPAAPLQIVSRPFSLGGFAVAGLALLLGAFVCGRYLHQLDEAAAGASVITVAPVVRPTAAPQSMAQTAQPSAPKVVTVTIRIMKFSPEQIEINAGDTIEWKNADLTPHTATAPTKEFDSGPINPTASWRMTFAKPGTFPYLCTFHPEMRGVVVVK
jgi:plastocyanin